MVLIGSLSTSLAFLSIVLGCMLGAVDAFGGYEHRPHHRQWAMTTEGTVTRLDARAARPGGEEGVAAASDKNRGLVWGAAAAASAVAGWALAAQVALASVGVAAGPALGGGGAWMAGGAGTIVCCGRALLCVLPC
jgi:hypothetical protein